MASDAAAHEVTVLGPDRWHESYDVFMTALHMPPASADRWERVRGLYHPGRTYGVVDADEVDSPVVGTLMSTPMEMTLPGGRRAPAAGASASGVLAEFNHRGLMSALARTQLRDMADQGEIFWLGRPSVATFWHRWGVGPASRTQGLRIDRLRTGIRPDLARRRDRVRRIGPGTRLPEVLASVQPATAGVRPGTVIRPAAWWPCWDPHAHLDDRVSGAFAGDAEDPDGYVTWYVDYEGVELSAMRRVLHVVELFARTLDVAVDLWSYLLRLELVEEISALGRPLDEQVPLLLVDQRACAVGEVRDELWLRLVDVAEALRIRGWAPTAGEAVVLEVSDELLPANSGRYRISSAGAERVTSSRPDLSCSVLHLATLYLGDRTPSQLAAAGMLEVHDGASVARADRLFAVDAAPWCGSMF
jgi:predicted acetyltransferase